MSYVMNARLPSRLPNSGNGVVIFLETQTLTSPTHTAMAKVFTPSSTVERMASMSGAFDPSEVTGGELNTDYVSKSFRTVC